MRRGIGGGGCCCVQTVSSCGGYDKWLIELFFCLCRFLYRSNYNLLCFLSWNKLKTKTGQAFLAFRARAPATASAPLNLGKDHSQSNGEYSLLCAAEHRHKKTRACLCMSFANLNCPRRRQILEEVHLPQTKIIKDRELRKNEEKCPKRVGRNRN